MRAHRYAGVAVRAARRRVRAVHGRLRDRGRPARARERPGRLRGAGRAARDGCSPSPSRSRRPSPRSLWHASRVDGSSPSHCWSSSPRTSRRRQRRRSPALMLLRVAAALAAASTTPALFAFAAAHAPAEKVGRFIAVVSLGVTGSIAAGVPLGTWIGGAFGWRATFAAMAVAGALVLVFVLARRCPEPRGQDETPALREQVRTLRRLPISLGLLANCVLMTGSMMMLTYLAPYLASTTTAGRGGTGARVQPVRDRRHPRNLARRHRHRPLGRRPSTPVRHRRTIVASMLALWGTLGRRPAAAAARARRGHGLGRHGVLELTGDPGPPAPPRGSRLRTSPGAQHLGHLPRRVHRSRSRGLTSSPVLVRAASR
jgi:hypothetical protein